MWTKPEYVDLRVGLKSPCTSACVESPRDAKVRLIGRIFFVSRSGAVVFYTGPSGSGVVR